VHARLARDGGLGRCRDRAQHARATGPRHLRDEPPGAARRRVHEDGVALLDGIGRVGQVVRRHALQHGGGCGGEVDRVGQRHELRCGDDRVLGVGAADHRVGDAIADRHLGHVRPDGVHRAGGLAAGCDWQVRLVEAGAEVHVDVVHAAGRDADACRARPGLGDRRVGEPHRLGSARLMHLHDLHHASLALSRRQRRRWLASSTAYPTIEVPATTGMMRQYGQRVFQEGRRWQTPLRAPIPRAPVRWRHMVPSASIAASTASRRAT
jgi:hypothetical protein